MHSRRSSRKKYYNDNIIHAISQSFLEKRFSRARFIASKRNTIGN